MSLFNTLHSMWSSWYDARPVGTLNGPLINVDGTPMLNDTIDILGHPFGVTNDSSAHDWSAGADMGMSDSSDPWSNGSGGSNGFGDGF